MKANRGALEKVEGDLYMTHASRVVKILLLLQRGHSLTAQDMVQRFGISRRSVYNDLEALEDAGVKIERVRFGKTHFSLGGARKEHEGARDTEGAALRCQVPQQE